MDLPVLTHTNPALRKQHENHMRWVRRNEHLIDTKQYLDYTLGIVNDAVGTPSVMGQKILML